MCLCNIHSKVESPRESLKRRAVHVQLVISHNLGISRALKLFAAVSFCRNTSRLLLVRFPNGVEDILPQLARTQLPKSFPQ